MNRVLGDYFETLLYKIFVSIDEQTSVAELADMLQIDVTLVKVGLLIDCLVNQSKYSERRIRILSSWNRAQTTNRFTEFACFMVDRYSTCEETLTATVDKLGCSG